ncbi:kinase-like domain-containing protein [Lasiosphaeris hirsuta]|uniref:EKC/KEOPS complex subunit BUD32 n=1 Tax=Lasiosphaeris hirsuta TaxID=260670 RepID=A0AA40AS22_9PEZI|nr:kinase-like domain-containing protein [Lasiosphaeris hirsuta]
MAEILSESSIESIPHTIKTITFNGENWNVEDPRQFLPGGFYPAYPGQTLSDHFVIRHKLGFGATAATWLCRDTVREEWVAVKVLKSKDSSENSPEFRALVLLQQDKERDAELLDLLGLAREHFWIQGAHGSHLCLVLPLLGPNLTHAFRLFGKSPLALIAMCHDMTKAMRFMHRKGVCHGDFTPMNVLLRFADEIHQLDEEALFELLRIPLDKDGKPWMIPKSHVLRFYTGLKVFKDLNTSCPEYFVAGLENLDTLSNKPLRQYLLPKIKVIDFGCSYNPADLSSLRGDLDKIRKTSKALSLTGCPPPWRPPEMYYRRRAPCYFRGSAGDIWALGITIFRTFCGLGPFCFPAEPYGTHMGYGKQMLSELHEYWGPQNWQMVTREDAPRSPKEFRDLAERCESIEAKRLERRDRNRKLWLGKFGTSDRFEALLLWGLRYDEKPPAKYDESWYGLPQLQRLGIVRPLYATQVQMDLLCDLMRKMFRRLPANRLPLKEVEEHPWFLLGSQPDGTIASMPGSVYVPTEADYYK